jgi:predicted RND superfamily exporter protein
LRDRIEAALGRWGRFVSDHAIWVVLATLVATALFATQLQHFRLDTSMDSYFHEGDPIRIQYDAFRDIFGRDMFFVVALKPEGGVFQADFLDELRVIHDEIENEVPLLVEVTSLINVRETLGDEFGLTVDDFLEDWPDSDEAVLAAKNRALGNPLYRNLVISEDGLIASIVIETEAFVSAEDEESLGGFDDSEDGGISADAESSAASEPVLLSGDDEIRIMHALQYVLARHTSDALEIHITGMPAFNAVLSQRIGQDMATFTGLSILLVALFLGVLFRRAAAIVLPIVTVILSVISTLAFMGAMDIPLMPPTQSIPTFLLAVGIGGTVHLMTIFYQAQRRGADKAEAISFALSHSGLAIIMTSLTTAGGLISFSSAALRPISHFGIITPIGVLLSLFYVLTFLPALLAIFPMRAASEEPQDTKSQRALIGIGAFSSQRSGLVLVAWTLLVGISIAGISRLTIGHDMVKWLPPIDSQRQSIAFLNENLGGAVTFEVLISSPNENALHDPELLRKIDEVRAVTEGFTSNSITADRALSIVDVVKETHRALNENQSEFYVIPDNRELISQELLLFENSGSDDVENLVTSQFDTARMTVRVPLVDGALYLPFMDAYSARLRSILGDDVSVQLTGGVPLLANTIHAALATMLRSYATALVIISILMMLLLGSVRVGLLSMIPNLVPVIFALGLMGWLGIPIDMLNLMLGSIVIGLAVDDTIHFMHNFRREIEATGQVDLAVANTLRGTGQALFLTSCVLASGFLVYTQAYMHMLFNFGILTASAIAVAFLADLTLAPALVSKVSWSKHMDRKYPTT